MKTLFERIEIKMSKKNKNKWDLTLDEQSETLDLFARMQTDPEACNTILGLHKIKDAPEELGETGLPVSLEKNIINDMEKIQNKNKHNNDININSGSDGYNKRPWEEQLLKNYPEEEAEENDIKTTETTPVLNITPINTSELLYVDESRTTPIYQSNLHDDFYKQYELDGKYIPSLDRVSISDGISQPSLSIKMMSMTTSLSTTDIDSKYDADYIVKMITILKEYIISCTHPSVIIPNDEYDKMVSQVVDFDDKHYHFIVCDRYVLMYVVRDKFHEIFDCIPEKYNMDTDTMFTYYITLASLAGTSHNIFEIDDESYVLHLKEMRDPVKETLINDFLNTCKLSNDGEKVLNRDTGSMIVDASVLQREARDMMIELDDSFDIYNGYNDDDEDDEEGDISEDNDGDISTDISEEEFSDTISFDSLNDNKPDKSTNQSSDDMTINVVRKN